jgi:2-hydroxy-3-keto-5-methylthiopentenyl-1-phosphate phosphatase
VVSPSPRFILVSDFDGTITEEDLVVTLTCHFSAANSDVVDAIYRGDLSLRQGLARLFGNLASTDRDQHLAYAREHGRLRQGFEEALSTFESWRVPFFVVSNGLDFMVRTLLAGHVDADYVYCNRADFSHPEIHITWPWPCDDDCTGDCGLCKPRVIRRLREQYHVPVVFIGDGHSDFRGAEEADWVFARASLARHLTDRGVPYLPFDTFTEIQEYLASAPWPPREGVSLRPGRAP